MRKSVLFWLVFSLSLVIALYFAVRVSMAVMGMTGAAYLNKISVKTDTNQSATGIADALRLPAGKSVYLINLDSALGKLTGQSDISDAAIRRTASGRIIVKIVSREIVATWTDGEKFYRISADGRFVGNALSDRPTDTFVFAGKLPKNIDGIVDTLNNYPAISNHIRQLEWIDNRRWDMYADGGIKIMMPEKNLDGALSKLATIQKQNNILGRALTMIDMRDADRTLVKVDGTTTKSK